jgi:uncharacterized Zn-binding protein involved in type VI secretion
MPGIVTEIDPSQGHCWPPTLPNTGALQNQTVFIRNKKIVTFGDQYNPHTPACTSPPTTHNVVASIMSSPSVFINRIPVIRDGDLLSCGDAADSLGASVFADGGGQGPVQQIEGLSATTGYVAQQAVVTYPVVSAVIYRRMNKIYRGLNSNNQPTYTYEFVDWCPNFSIENDWSVKIIQEGTGTEFINRKGIGAPELPQEVNDVLRNPLNLLFALSDGSNNRPVSEELPPGLTLNSETGTIAGTPTVQSFSPRTLYINAYFNEISSDNLRSNSVYLYLRHESIYINSPYNEICP